MKVKYILIIIFALFFAAPIQAQQKSLILSDIRLTMQDFMSDISNINEDKKYFKENLQSLSQTYASDTYFMSNGVQQNSFYSWAEEYCTLHLTGLAVQHSLDILEHSLQKVDASNEDDKRYRFEAALLRTWADGHQTTDNLSFVVIWNGRKNYVSLTEINGQFSTISSMSGEQLYSLAKEHSKMGNANLAKSLLRQSAEKGYQPAAAEVGNLYFTNKEYNEAYKWLTKAKDTSGRTFYQLGWMHENGKGVSKDWIKALDYYEKSLKGKYYLTTRAKANLEARMISNNMIYQAQVVDEQGKPVNAAAINIKGTDNHFLSDFYGNFTIRGLQKGDVLIISSPLYESKSIAWSSDMDKIIRLKRKGNNSVQGETTQLTSNITKNVVTSLGHGVCQGKVTDSKGKYINAAIVSIEGTDIKVLTNYWGEYELKGLRTGDNIVVTNPGYQPTVIKWSGRQQDIVILKNNERPVQTTANRSSQRQTTTQTKVQNRTKYTYSGKVVGVVKDRITKKNLNQALVQIEGTDIKVLTDYWGEFTLTGLKDGDKLIISNYGYQTKTQVWYKSHQKTIQNYFLNKQ